MGRRVLIIVPVLLIISSLLIFSYVKIKKKLSYSDPSLASMPVDEIPTMEINSFKLEETDGPKSSWVLFAKKAQMFKSSEKLLFIDVRAIVNADLEGKDVYNISSELGSYQIKNDKVVLEKNVSVSTSHRYKVLTDKLEYFAKTKKINSSDIVSISGKTPSGEQLSIEGIGINGDLGSGDFSIVKKISTKFGKNLMISSQHASFNTNKDVVVFEKDMVAKKDNLDIKGDKLVVKYVSTGEIKDIEVLGNVRIQAGDKKYALCDRAVMKDRSSQVELTGKPEFHVDKDIIVGQKIVFFADSDEVYVEKVKAEVSEQTVRKKK